jgi:hypothetical protein
LIGYAGAMKSFPACAAVALALSLGLAGSACSSKRSPSSSHLAAAEARNLLLDRNWIDRMPDNARDRLRVFRFVPSMGGGVFQDRTLFKGTFELFRFEATGDEIRFIMPETGERVRARYTIDAVDGPAPFDLRLSIPDSPRGPKVYFGMRAETDRDGQKLDAALQSLAK